MYPNLFIQKKITLKSVIFFGAGSGNRTRIASLEGWNSAIELHLRFLTTFIIITAVLKFVNSIFKFF